MAMPEEETKHSSAAEQIAAAEALLICAGAGMGVDSGLPDFRSKEGFWRAYPQAERLGLRFEQLANPCWFDTAPDLAWGFYGHRLQLYRKTQPHEGFEILRRWAESKEHGHFVFTSNVDGQFQKAGFPEDRVVEVHGSVLRNQCVKPCCESSWPVPETLHLEVEEATLRARSPLPRCMSCKGQARPNVLMFEDTRWTAGASSAQQIRLRLWLRGLARGKLAVVEIGAGHAVPTVRQFAEQVARAAGTPLIRINPKDTDGPANALCFAQGGLEALRRIDACLNP